MNKPVKAHVYFARNESNGLVKIGFSTRLENRIARIQSEQPAVVTLLLAIATDSPRQTERIFHRIYAEKRVKGEWFQLTNDDVLASPDRYKSYENAMLLSRTRKRLRISQVIEQWRISTGLSLLKAAQLLGISAIELAAFEVSANPRAETMSAVFRSLVANDCAWLLGERK